MSDSRGYEELSVTSDGVHVLKRFEEEEFPVPAIAFEFRSHRDEEVHVVLSDTVPEEIAVEDLGFHPEYGSEHWVIDDESRIVFERDLAPEESYTTVYGIRATGSDSTEKFLTEPTLVAVEPPLSDEESSPVVRESGDDIIGEAVAGDSELPGLEADNDEEDIEKLDLNDPGQSADSGKTSASDESEDSIVAAMAEELRQQQASAEDLKILREAFEAVDEERGTAVAKVEQIQEDVADLRAYTGALEEFLDENGTAQQILDEFERQLDSYESQLSSLNSTVQENSEQLESVTAAVDSFEDDVQSIDADVRALDDEIDSVAGDVDEIDNRFDEFEDALSDIESDLSELENAVTDREVGERVDEIEDNLDELRAWQEQIKQTFGG